MSQGAHAFSDVIRLRVTMVCRTLSVGGVSSIEMPVYIGGLSNS